MQLIDDARHGAAGALVVLGEAGIGKTTLLNDAAATATDFAVLRAQVAEFEVDMPYAALHQLCSPRLALLSTLAAPRRQALEVAFGLRTGPAPDRFLLGLGLVDLLSAVAPTLCVIDDAQWIDAESSEVLAVAARHLSTEAVAVLMAARAGSPSCAAIGDLPVLQVPELSSADSWLVLSASLPAPLDVRVRDQILAESDGNPLALVELSQAAGLAGIAGGFGLPATVSAPERVEHLYRGRLAALSESSRRIVLIAAADPTGDPTLQWRAAATIGLDWSANVAAVDSGLIDIGTRVRFRHPLARSAVYQAAEPAERRAAHAALAEATDKKVDPDRYVWHRARAVVPPDEVVSVDLEHAAERARARGGAAAAAAFLEGAFAKTADRRRRCTLALQAASAKHAAGDLDGALVLLASAELNATDDTEAARVAMARAEVAFDRGHDFAQAKLLLAAAEGLVRQDAWAASAAYLRALVALYLTERLDGVPLKGEIAEVIHNGPTRVGHPGIVDSVLNALTLAIRSGRAQAVSIARTAVSMILNSDDQCEYNLLWAWIVCCLSWDDESWLTIVDRHLSALRAAGRLAEMNDALNYRALAYLHTGELSRAHSLLDEAKTLRAVTGAADRHYVELVLAGWRGDLQSIDRLFDDRLKAAVEHREARAVAGATYARVLVYNSAGRYDLALQSAEMYLGHDVLGFHVYLPQELIEAAAHTGRRELANQLLDQLGGHAVSADTPWSLGIERRCRAMVSDDSEAEQLFVESAMYLSASRARLQLARTELLFGEWLRRRQRRSDARPHLRTALTMFSDAGAEQFAKRAARELRASGEVAKRQAAGHNLTAQELMIAQSVAAGATSKEVAAELVLSPRTIDAHLRNIFGKLEITSRRQIREAMENLIGSDNS
jgi:DNA-binding CsgD family transcriptional regulator